MIEAIKKMMAGRDAVADAFRTVDVIREAVAEKKAEVDRIEAAPVPVGEAMSAIDGWIDSAATQAVDRLGLRHLIEPGRAASGFRLPVHLVRIGDVGSFPDASAGQDVLLGLVLALNRDGVRDLIKGQLADFAIGRETVPNAERAERIELARAELLRAEMMEEAALRQIETLGIEVQRRADADPRAVLAADASLPR